MFDSVRTRRLREAQQEDLNMTPFLDVMIVLIPFLMFSASFATIVAIPASLPTAVASADQAQKPTFDLLARATSDSLQVYLDPAGPDAPPTFAIATGTGDDYDETVQRRFHDILVDIKRRHPTETRIALDAEPGVSLQKVTRLMDLSRELVPTDTGIPRVAGSDARLLFPQVALKGVYAP